jgi:hypothetical protein
MGARFLFVSIMFMLGFVPCVFVPCANSQQGCERRALPGRTHRRHAVRRRPPHLKENVKEHVK